MRRLDSLAAEVPHQRIFLKVDTQGYDMRVIAGAGSFLDRVRVLQVELSVTPLYESESDYIDSLAQIRDLAPSVQ